MELGTLFQKFKNMRILVVGDVMIDAYYRGNVNRISPEAPVPIVSVTSSENRPGGAANVALNLLAMGATPVLCSVVGDDLKGDLFLDLLRKSGMGTKGIIKSKERPTTVKTRIMSAGQHLLRVDEEVTTPLSATETDHLMQSVRSLMEEGIDAVVLEDYNKGVLTSRTIEGVIELAHIHKVPTAVDPKKDNFFNYRGVTLFKPNLKELKEGLKVDFDKSDVSALLDAVSRMEVSLQNEISLVTLSEMGVLVKKGNTHSLLPAFQREIVDVSGAGDTVISVAVLCLAAGADHEQMAAMANLAGGLVCEKSGVVPIDAELLRMEAQKRS